MGKKCPDIYEVGPRDGFQNIKDFIPTQTKLETVRLLLESGVKRIQLTSFVSPKAIPQLADARKVTEHFAGHYPDVTFGALVPNLYGAKAAYDCGIREIAYVASVSESHNQANINRTHRQSLEELMKIREKLPDISIIFGMATSFGCPFEGETPLDKLVAFMEQGVRAGADIIELSDTIGSAYPQQVRDAFRAAKQAFPGIPLGYHSHDTRNMGILNSWIALEEGTSYLQSSIGGLGGCPFAPGASGNCATEDLVYSLNKSGYDTGIDFDRLLTCARYVKERVDGCFSGHQINLYAQKS